MSAKYPKVLDSTGLPIAIASTWPSIIKHDVSVSVTDDCILTFWLRTPNKADLFPIRRLPLRAASDNGTGVSSCWSFFSKFTACPALYAVISCIILMSAFITLSLSIWCFGTLYNEPIVSVFILTKGTLSPKDGICSCVLRSRCFTFSDSKFNEVDPDHSQEWRNGTGKKVEELWG